MERRSVTGNYDKSDKNQNKNETDTNTNTDINYVTYTNDNKRVKLFHICDAFDRIVDKLTHGLILTYQLHSTFQNVIYDNVSNETQWTKWAT